MSETWHGEAFGEAPELPAPPAEPVEDTQVAPILYALVDCLETELDATPGGPPCFVGVVPGANVAMDFCDCDASGCGMGYVRLDTVYPSTQFPIQDTTARCTAPLAARVAVGVTRCLPTMDDSGNAPTVLQQAQAVQNQMADMMAARRAIACCLDPAVPYMLGAYTPVGPYADCGGGFWLVTFQVM